MEYRHVVREVYPSGMPMMIQGEIQPNDSTVNPDTCAFYPVFDDKVLPASPMLDDKTRNNIALRLTNIILKN